MVNTCLIREIIIYGINELVWLQGPQNAKIQYMQNVVQNPKYSIKLLQITTLM